MNRTMTFRIDHPFSTGFRLAAGILVAAALFSLWRLHMPVAEDPPIRIELSPQISEPHYERQDYRGPV